MPHYLDPKADLVFKKIFGQHPDLLKSFLNAVLPLPPDALIDQIDYLPSDLVPPIPNFKYTVVDVKCIDQQGQSFIVEMQIQWTDSFMQRMLFNASKVYISQLKAGQTYDLLKPVYRLGLINANFDPDDNAWYHHYKMVNIEKPRKEIKDLQMVFIELPKFKAQNIRDKKLRVLWLRFLSEIDDGTTETSSELSAVPEIEQAIALAEQAAYTETELNAYHAYWDVISTEKTLLKGTLKKGLEEGLKKGLKKGLKEGLKEGRKEGLEEGLGKGLKKGREEGLKEGLEKGLEKGLEAGERRAKQAIARQLLVKGSSLLEVAALTGLSITELKRECPPEYEGL